MEVKRTKLICTIGPASDKPDILRKIMQIGMNAARLNFSHGTHPEHKYKIDLIKGLREELGLPVAIILDTKGPEIRTGKFEGGSADLVGGQTFTICTGEITGNSRECSTSYMNLVNDVSVGDRILIDDGLIGLGVQSVEDGKVICAVRNGGRVRDNKSINVPGVKVSLPAMSERDRDDIEFGIREGVDFIAASFIRKASDVVEIREFLDMLGGQKIKIISKIENKEGVENIGEIIEVSDGVMVARGDLGVEIPPEEVPLIQKDIIRSCNRFGRFVITATQMMDSMIRNPRPTRAEVADVANAILDGADAVMLSGETASGKYPLEAVQMMADVSRTTEKALFSHSRLFREGRGIGESDVSGAISAATCNSADSLRAKAIVTPTSSGRTAQTISMHRPRTPIIAFSTEETAVRQLSLVWGVTAFHLERFDDQQDFFRAVKRNCIEKKLAEQGDLIVLTAGIPLGVSGNTNMLRIHEIGHVF